MRRLLFFFKPSNKLFSSLDLNDSASRVIASTGLEFLRFLLDCANVSDHQTSRVLHLNLMSVVNVQCVYHFQDESTRLIKEWLTDIGSCLSDVRFALEKSPSDFNLPTPCEFVTQIKGHRPSSDALFSPHRVTNTCAQYYFLYIGLLSSTSVGDQLLKKAAIYPTFVTPVLSNNKTCYKYNQMFYRKFCVCLD